MLSTRGAFEMENESGRMATMEGFPFYNIPAIRVKAGYVDVRRIELRANE